MKKTTVTPSATFDQIPSPNQSRKIGANTTRGSAFRIFMKGSASAPNRGDRASAKPHRIPAPAPKAKASAASSSATRRCGQIDPVRSHVMMRAAISLGRLKKNLSSLPVVTSTCQVERNATAIRIWPKRRDALARIAGEHLLFELGPDFAIEF